MKKLADLEDVKLSSLTELEEFFREKNIPQEKTRFFVNQNKKEAKCFGIYQDVDTGKFIVYKNKADGSRFVRYEGDNEKEAVSIFFDKLKEEMAIRDTQGLYKSTIEQVKEEKQQEQEKKNNLKSDVEDIAVRVFGGLIVLTVIVAVFYMVYAGFVSLAEDLKPLMSTPQTGYYKVNETYYYYGNHAWWYYDTSYNGWKYLDGYLNDYDNYYYSEDYSDNQNYSNIIDSQDYESYAETHSNSSNDSWSSGYSSSGSSYYYSSSDFDSYNFSSWNSSYTNWNSDW